METAALSLQVNSKGAVADLGALSRALNDAGKAFSNMESRFAAGGKKTEEALQGAVKSAERAAAVASLLNRIKVDPAGAGGVREFAAALDQLGRVKTITEAKITTIRQFLVMVSAIKPPANVAALGAFMKTIENIRAPSASTITRLREFLMVVSGAKVSGTAISAGMVQTLRDIAAIKPISQSTTQRLKDMLQVLSTAKQIPGAKEIARDLDLVAAAAGRASAALARTPPQLRAMSSAASQAATRTREASESLSLFKGRLDLGYQAGTLFTQLFASFTLGEFVRGVYEAGIEIQKLQKSLLFATGTVKDAQAQMSDFFAFSTSMGLSIDATAQSFSRFALSTKMAGLPMSQSVPIYKSVATALQVVGASTQQAQLALYALNEMFQKGTVQSKEFIRQFAAQIPGAVALGARALSDLKGKFVSTGDFMEMMHKKQIDPTTFMPAFAKELDATINKLKDLVSLRPDAQMNMLRNAFFEFKKEVGDGGFMAAMTFELHKFFGEILDGSGHLTPQVKELADTLGRNLASGVHMLADGLGFLVHHLHDVIEGLRGLGTIALGMTFLNWSRNASIFVDGLIEAKKQAIATKLAMVPSGASVAAGAANAVVGTSSSGSAAAFAMRARMAGGGSSALSGVASMAAGGLNLAKQGFLAIGAVMPSISTILMASAVALAVFGDKLTGFKTSAGNAIDFADIVLGAFDTIFGSVSSWVKTMIPTMGKLGDTGTQTADAVTIVMASIKTLLGGLFSLASDIGEVIGHVFANIIEDMRAWMQAAGRVLHGDFGGANRILEENRAVQDYQAQQLGKVLKDSLAAFDVKKNLAEVIQASQAHADARANAANHTGDAQLDALRKQHEQEIADMNKRFAEADAEGKREALAREAQSLSLFEKGPDIAQLLRDIADPTAAAKRDNDLSGFMPKTAAEVQMDAAKDAAKSTTTAGDTFAKTVTSAADHVAAALNPNGPAANGAMQVAPGVYSGFGGKTVAGIPANIDYIITTLSKAAGIDPTVARIMAQRESHFDPNAKAPTSSAAGLFQFTEDTWSNKRGTGVMQGHSQQDRFDPMQATIGFLKLVKQNQLILQQEIGRMPTAGELYEAHFLGPAAAGKLINAVTSTPDANAAEVLYGSVVAKAARANPKIFRNGNITLAQLDKNLLHTMGESRTTSVNAPALGAAGDTSGAALAGAGLATLGDDTTTAVAGDTGETETAADKLNKQIDAFHSQAAHLLGHDPGLAAEAERTETALTLKKVRDFIVNFASTHPGASLPKDQLDDLNRAMAFAEKQSDDKANPLAKENRLADQSYAAEVLRNKGMIDEADWLTKINALREQGYDVDKLNLDAQYALFQANRDRLDQLKDQSALLDAQRNAQLKLIQATQGAASSLVAQQVLAAYPGMSLADAMKKAQDDGRLGNFQGIARTEMQSTANLSMISQSNQIASAREMVGRQGSDAAYFTNLKQSLAEMEGVDANSKTLAELTANASDSMKEFAANAAKAKTELEHPPGFAAWVDGLKPFKDSIEDIKKSFMDTLSNNITDSLSGKKVDWKQSAYDLTRQLLKAEVDQNLSLGLKALGIGGNKPTSAEAAVETQATAAATFSTSTTTFAQAVQQFATVAGGGGGAVGGVNQSAIAGTSAAIGAAAVAASQTGQGGGVSSVSSIANAVGASPAASGLVSAIAAAAGVGAANDNMDVAAPGTSLVAPVTVTTNPVNGPITPIDRSKLISAIPNFVQPDSFSNLSTATQQMTAAGLLSPDGISMIKPTGIEAAFSSGAAGGAAGVGGLGGAIKGLGTLLGGGASGGVLGDVGNFLSPGGGPLGLGGIAGLALTSLIAQHLAPKAPKVYKPVNGVIGAPSTQTMTGELIPGHANIIGTILDMVAGKMTGGFGATGPNGSPTSWGSAFGNIGSNFMSSAGGLMSGASNFFGGIGSFLGGLFSEGGYATSPVARGSILTAATFRSVPHYAEGTHNTSGGMPAILHPDEAVIPLSRGRSIPVDMRGQQSAPVTHVHAPIYVTTPDADSFRKSHNSITRKQNTNMRRSAIRNAQSIGGAGPTG